MRSLPLDLGHQLLNLGGTIERSVSDVNHKLTNLGVSIPLGFCEVKRFLKSRLTGHFFFHIGAGEEHDLILLLLVKVKEEGLSDLVEAKGSPM